MLNWRTKSIFSWIVLSLLLVGCSTNQVWIAGKKPGVLAIMAIQAKIDPNDKVALVLTKNIASLSKNWSSLAKAGESGQPDELMILAQPSKDLNFYAEVQTWQKDTEVNPVFIWTAALKKALLPQAGTIPDKWLLVETVTKPGGKIFLKGMRILSTSSKRDTLKVNSFEIPLSSGEDYYDHLSLELTRLVNGFDHASPGLTSLSMVKVKGGCFLKGDTFNEGEPNEKPVTKACVESFYVGRYLITKNQWSFVMDLANNKSKEHTYYPKAQINWNDIEGFLKKLNDITGENYRLLQEEEWEYICRNAGRDVRYPTSSGNMTSAEANFQLKKRIMGSTRVNFYPPSPLGLYDLSGNLWEWTSSRYTAPGQGHVIKNFFKGQNRNTKHVMRGGSFDSNKSDLRCSRRNFTFSWTRAGDVGFRLARDE